MKRIIIFSTAYHPFIGGAEVAVREITDRIKGFDFDLVTARMDINLPEQERVGKVNVYRVGFGKPVDKLLLPVWGLAKAVQMHRAQPYDALWSIMASHGGFAAVLFKTIYSKVPFILTLQEGDPIPNILKKVRLVRPLFNRIFTKADKIQAISEYLASWARDMGHVGEIAVIPNGFEKEVFNKKLLQADEEDIKNTIEKKRKEMGLTPFFQESTKIFITTSRLVEKNGIDIAIKSLIALPENIKFLVVGDGPLMKQLETFAQDRGVRERVHFVGSVAYEDIYKYLKLPEVFAFVRASRSEGMGNSFIEAMASGVPVIGTPVGGIVDFLFDPDLSPEHKPTGLLARAEDQQNISYSVRRYYEDEGLGKTLSENAREFIEGKYEWNTIAQSMQKEVFNTVFEK